VISLVAERLKRDDCREGFILDGFPRNVIQGKMLEKTLAQLEMALDGVLYFATDAEVVMSRLTARLICRACGANFHKVNIPPKVDGVCDKCGGELYQREDDRRETVKKRLDVYEEQTAPLIAFYRDRGLLQEMSGDLEVEAGQAAIRAALGVSSDKTD
jgi:adenylate kinase